MDSDYEFRSGPLVLLPYVAGACAFSEKILAELFDRIHEEDLWPIVFHEDPGLTLARFYDFFSNGKALLQILVTMDNDKLVGIAGLSWLADIAVVGGAMTRGFGSFMFFRKYQTPAFTTIFGDLILKFWFTALNMDTICGITPEPNRAARNYVQRLGFTEVGRIPNYTTFDGKVVDGWVNAMTKEQYLQLPKEAVNY